MRQSLTTLEFRTPARGLVEITREVAAWIASTGIGTGLATLHCKHTSASLLICENAAPAVRRDVLDWLDKLAPEGPFYEHDDEGPDDMPAHLRAVLTGAGLSIPVTEGRMALGTWQGVFLAEHRARPHQREIAVHLIGE
jgi:secondary thiamine-phosphate synthase enzyme